MLDYKDIIMRHSALGMSGGQNDEALWGSKSGVNDFLRAFKAYNCYKCGKRDALGRVVHLPDKS